MRLPCCDGGFDAGRFGGGRDAEKSSRRGVALLCAGGEVVFLLCFLERNGGGFCLVRCEAGLFVIQSRRVRGAK